MTGYVRKDTTNNIADGNVINAADLDAEFDGVQDAFNASTGHNHDGTTGEGAPITALGPTQDVTISAILLAPKTTNTVDIGSSSLRYKDLFLAGNGSIGGTLAVTGVATLGAGAILNTPASVTLTNATGLPISTGVSGLGTGIATALAVNTGSAGAPVLFNGALGTPSSGTVTNLTGTASININGTVGATTPASGAFTTLSASSTVTLSGGTASGVLYLNGSKVVTSGSALTFDGSNLVNGGNFSTGTSGLATYFRASGTAYTQIGDNQTLGAGTAFVIGSSTPYLAGNVAGSEQIRLTTTGLGIGTSSPSQKLQVVSASGGTTARFSNTNANFIDFYETTTSTRLGYIGTTDGTNWTIHNDKNGSLGFDLNNSEQMRLTSTGLGIGTSSPASKLHVDNGSGCRLYVGLSNNIYEQAYDHIWQTLSGASTKMTLDSSGNLGLGVTPNTWYSTFRAFQFGGNGSSLFGRSENNMAAIGSNVYVNAAGSNTYINTNTASYFQQLNGAFQWYTAPSGTAGNAITFTQAMTLNASGNLGVGATSMGTTRLVIRGDATTNFAVAKWSHSSNASSGFDIGYASSVASNDVSIWNYENGFIRFATNNTERARIDSSGNFGIGTSSPATKLDVAGGSSADVISIRGRTSDNFGLLAFATSAGTKNAYIGSTDSTNLVFYTNGFTERARINATGDLLLGTTSNSPAGTVSQFVNSWSGGAKWGISLNQTVSSATAYTHINFSTNGTTVGNINANNTATTYATSSDYRLKNSVAPMTGALAKVAQLKPCTYKWNADGSDGEGFIAHELAEVVPQCVTGEKDAVNEDGTPKYQGIDTSFLVATLTAAIQELKAEFDAYKASHP